MDFRGKVFKEGVIRRSGCTTRNIDEAIQVLFERGALYVPSERSIKDDLRSLRATKYHPIFDNGRKSVVFIDGETTRQQSFFLDKVLNRLSFEHSMKYKGRFPIDRIITLDDFEQGKGFYYKEPNLWNSIGTWLGWKIHIMKVKYWLWKK